MKILLIALIIFFGGLLAFLPNKMDISKKIEINAPADIVFNHMSDLKKMDEWSYWNTLDPNMKIEWGEKTEGLDASYKWFSDDDNVGNGEMFIVEHEPMEHIKTKMLFEGSDEPMFADMYFKELNGSVMVEWGMHVSYGTFDLFGRSLSLIIEGVIEDAYKKSLEQMKELIESGSYVDYNLTIEKGEFSGSMILAVIDTTTCQSADIENSFKGSLGTLYNFFMEKKIPITGVPMTIAHKWDPVNDVYIYEAAMPVSDDQVIPESDIVYSRRISGGNAVVAEHTGPYSEFMRTYRRIEWFMEKNSLKANGYPMEVYISDPGEVPPEELKTLIYFPI